MNKVAFTAGFNLGLKDFSMNQINPGPDATAVRSLPVITVKDKPINVEVVTSDKQQQLGLMFREQLHENHGMLFVYPVAKPLSFWMKDTVLALSIAYIGSDGTIVDIQKMEPLDENSYRSLAPAQFALEMPQSWFENNNIQIGDKVTM